MHTTDVPSDLHYSEYTIPSGGTRIVLSVWEPPRPDAVIVFVPATMVHPLFYETLLSGFAERGFAVVGVHPVGHGKSPRDVRRYTLRDIVQNAKDAVSFAEQRYRLPILSMGSSQGGIVAAALAAEDARIAAAFPHNIVLAELPDSIVVTRFPKFLRHVYRPLLGAFGLLARLLPDAKLPLKFYLQRNRISEDPAFWASVERDPLFLRGYSLYFLASLFTTVFPGLTNGGIHCPLYLITDTNDQLFTMDYTRFVFDRLRAPHKELIELDLGGHMFMATHPREVCEILSPKMREALAIVEAGNIEGDI
ncbi:MAG: alpha/beta fold hydrolase [Clostridiales Family XIII bacterium]|jgi:alpha-beta hydrolase superfamily lysophospholipase|nr:alpha/beta fold hydrolase [Clostridiales Family XIII bacterium]